MALVLGGCVTLLPKTAPVQLYRFDVAETEQPASAEGPGFWVHRAPTGFARGAEGDQILTMSGNEAAYIAGARWVAPASALFDDAESHAFDRSPGPAHLGRRGEVGAAPLSLRLDVETFEARYLDGAGAAPTVVVRVRASLDRTADRLAVATRLFESRKKAASNNVSAIVPQYEAALTEVMGQVVAWTNTEGAQAGSSPASASTASAAAKPGP
ncbi:membrane integrity-associated transporter subunit PqiC [Phenylobacterium montanum]|uniref:Membrane integrity-associated transporter subunit PqiC n=2 Tax=Phenylobacterium montanum TaxID=2823693 RepID=A0A975IX94_9CAUL|nr:membrane integrity-associated transporter subunit PqiC [Caulobacter sp. S6]